ncbi:SLAM family member 8-like [Echeneis naucrates]|uniref:SLAM family member 8-like n=1 Tax=Echeneis naucrates TaxID=173247 RepID=UPI0011134025|nr:SLAM family member 8 [Echeneis naucrates]
MNGSTCTFQTLEHSHGVYWCESGSGMFSNAVNITIKSMNDSTYQQIVHKQAGDTVELPSGSPIHGVTSATWKYGDEIVADMKREFSESPQFAGRVKLNPTTFSLTVRGLTLGDSGDFSFLSEVNSKSKRETVTFTLQVHEPMTAPILTVSSTSFASDPESCMVFLKCSSASEPSVTYKWTVRDQVHSDSSTLQYVIRPQDRKTKFTCTVRNSVSEQSASTTANCHNGTFLKQETVGLLIGLIIGLILVVLLFIYTKFECCKRPARSQQVDQEPEYSSLHHVELCVYETLRGPEDAEIGARASTVHKDHL